MQKDLEPKQERSRRMLECLLRSTVAVVDEVGLDRATIPRIVEHAGVAPASVYRRFEDKDALVAAALLHSIKASHEAVERAVPPGHFAGMTLRKAVASLIHNVYLQYQRHPRLLRAIRLFADRDSDFDRQATEIFAANFRRLVDGLGECSDMPKRSKEKLQFGLMTVVTAIETRALEPSSLWPVFVKEPDEEVEKRFVEMVLSYVGK